MRSKLGPHIENAVNANAMINWFATYQPSIAKLIEDDWSFLEACRDVSPDTFWIGRAYVNHQDFSDPAKAAARMHRQIMSQARAFMVDAWEGYNEACPGAHRDDETEKYLEFELKLCRLLHAEGLQYVAGSWSVGCPDMDIWAWEPMLSLLSEADFLGPHEYLAPTMWDIRGFGPPYTDLDEYIAGGWYTLRYRKVYDILKQHLASVPPFLITECGIDSGAPHWDPGARGGWQSFGNLESYMSQLQWYDRQLQKDAYVLGATPFTFGTLNQEKWGTFDLWKSEGARKAFGKLTQLERPGPPPPPPPLPVPIPPSPPPPSLHPFTPEELAWEVQKHLTPFNPDTAFRRFAAQQDRWQAISNEFDWRNHRFQVYVSMTPEGWTQHIIYAPIGEWNDIRVVHRHN